MISTNNEVGKVSKSFLGLKRDKTPVKRPTTPNLNHIRVNKSRDKTPSKQQQLFKAIIPHRQVELNIGPIK